MSEIPLSGDPRVDAALQRITGKFQDLEDAVVVQAHLEKRRSEQIKSHAQWLQELEARDKEHEKRWTRIDIAMSEMTDKVNFLLDREMRREGGPEAR